MTNDLASTVAQSLNRDPMVGLRLARVDGFEPAIALGQDELPAYLRRFTMLFADDATMRRGGIGRVTRAVNAQGEAVALKQLILPTRDEFDDDVAHEALVAKFKAAFREEYECHRALSGLKGFPRLYGWGEVDGVPAIVMEWVEGETLARLRSRFAVDDAGRLSPLVAARLGRDLFDLLCRMSLVGEGFVHRDISPANIMVRTARLPLDRQLAEGTFDLCLIDFGSSLALEPASAVAGTGGKASFTERYATLRRATVAYAPPEMLTDDIPDLRALRMSPAIDVYAAASAVYELIAGVAPYEAAPGASGTSGSRKKTRDIASPYRLKMDTLPDYPVGAHAPGCDLTQLLRREPDVALAAAEQAQQLGLDPDSEDLRDALAFVDTQLSDVVMACLSCHQEDRPEPAAVEAALSAFCDHYAQNVARSLASRRAAHAVSDGGIGPGDATCGDDCVDGGLRCALGRGRGVGGGAGVGHPRDDCRGASYVVRKVAGHRRCAGVGAAGRGGHCRRSLGVQSPRGVLAGRARTICLRGSGVGRTRMHGVLPTCRGRWSGGCLNCDLCAHVVFAGDGVCLRASRRVRATCENPHGDIACRRSRGGARLWRACRSI